MGKGDRKTRKGKTFRKSFGVSRPHGKKGSGYIAPPKVEKEEPIVVEEPKTAAKPKKKVAPKKKPTAKESKATKEEKE